MPSIGIIGAGNIGRAIATALAAKGIAAILSNSRGPASLKDVVSAIGPSIAAGAREEVAARDLVFIAVNWSKFQPAMAGLPDFDGRIVIDTNNPLRRPRSGPSTLARGRRRKPSRNLHLAPAS